MSFRGFKRLSFGFTMAEAILVMTILGIIATIMISTLKPAEFKEKSLQILAKKVLSELDVATPQILMNDTKDGTFDTLFDSTGEISKFPGGVDEVYSSGARVANLYKKYLTALRKKPKGCNDDNCFVLKDGAAIEIVYRTGFSDSIFPGETEVIFMNDMDVVYGTLMYDVNDDEGPNIEGKDIFSLPLGKEGIIYSE